MATSNPNNGAAESNFRQGLSGFAWARPGVVTDDSQSAPTNVFSRWTSSISGAIPVRSNDRTNEEEASVLPMSPTLNKILLSFPSGYFALSRWERFSGFLICTGGAMVCFLVAFFIGLPLLALKPRKFAVSFSLGSILFMIGFAILQGPLAHLKHIFTSERLPFTGAYFGSLILTLYFAVGRQSYLPTLICAIVQCGALISYFIAYFPGGWQTLSFGSRMAMRGAGSVSTETGQPVVSKRLTLKPFDS